ncbi:PTS lactose transporter subunit IIC [Pseudoclavibacter endophyticus]|uniref:PTS lactose transporter subunit IIC n=1 Tax=Pseudoclavibacter endophyticus TaxID=1778590 RepID=A0A6H9WPL0_9MICO|nr:fructose-specific PTS transporter subunit EIIC [Pseudoclavibacter endophyticus]KAB1648041.1 PTS lactose transporter subunit IIC [Pseudoclavibacter endophyticus]GGA69220.1 PTS lactose transporter subunit IIC [Pseudoclavibacter endophyticus]
MTDMITPELVTLDQHHGDDSAAVIRALAERIVAHGRATDAEALSADALAREQKDSTGIPGGIAIPHCRSAAVTRPTLAMSRLRPGVDFGAGDGPADLVFFIAAPEGADDAHLELLSKLARSLIRPDFTQALREADTTADVVALVDDAIGEGRERPVPGAGETAPTDAASGAGASGAPDAADVNDASGGAEATGARMTIIAVTACATGIAHTFMAADSLAEAGKQAGVDLHVEPQGSGSVRPLDPAVVDRAQAVIFATDVDVRDRARFVGKPVIQVPVKRGIDQAPELIERAVAAARDPQAPRVRAQDADGEAAGSPRPGRREPVGKRIQRWLMTGVSYMIPFVAGGGLLIALGFLLGGYDITDTAADILVENALWNLPEGGLGAYLGAVAFMIGNASMAFLVPALAGYIAYAIADRPGIAPGFVAGSVALLMSAGFIGGLVGGLIAGGVAWWLGTWRVPRWLAGLMPVVIIPLVASIVASGSLALVLGGPIAALMNALDAWLGGLTGGSAVLLGALLGAMMCFDLGGPINKVAYSFAVAGLGAGAVDNQAPWLIMAAVMAAGMVPPLGMALATFVAPRRFSRIERENGKAGVLLGAAFISEGAIPFAAADPLRVLPATIAGGAVTGAITMGMGVTSQAPHGGIFVFFAIGNVLWFVLAVLIGAVVTALVTMGLKIVTGRRAEPDTATGATPVAAGRTPSADATAATPASAAERAGTAG